MASMVRRALLVGLATGLWLALSSPSAGAHAVLSGSDPAGGALLQSAPPAVTLTFTEPPDESLSSIHVLDATGRQVESGPAEVVPGAPLQLTVPLGPAPNGVYTVTWRVLSKTDGHLTAGSFAFGVGVAPPTGAGSEGPDDSATPSPGPVAVAARWALYAGLAILLGGAVGGMVVSRVLPRGFRAVLAMGWFAAAAGLVALTLAKASALDVSLGTLFDSDTGRQLAAQGLALLVVGVALVVVLVRPRWTSLPALAGAAAGAMLVHVLGGHANAPSAIRGLNLAVQWVHVMSSGVWIGGLVWLLLILRSSEGTERIRAVARYSLLAGIALGGVIVTGILRSLEEVGGPAQWPRLFETGFGLTLVIKVGLFAGLVLLGARNRYVHVPGLAAGTRSVGTLRRTVTAELAIAVGIFGMTGVLTELPPAKTAATSPGHGHTPTPSPQEVVVTGNDFATSVKVRLVATPGSIGINQFEVEVTDFDTAEPVPADRVSLRFELEGRPDVEQSTVELEPQPAGTWTAEGAALSIDGLWSVTVLVQQGVASVEVPLEIQPNPPPQDVQIDRVVGAPTLYTIRLAGGVSVQAYADPGTAGTNEVHFTFFDAQGNELPVETVEVDGRPLDGSLDPLPVRPFGPGHVVADAELDPGPWRFWVRATTADGAVLTAYFDEQIRE